MSRATWREECIMKKILNIVFLLFLLTGCVTIQQTPQVEKPEENETVAEDNIQEDHKGFAVETLINHGKAVDGNDFIIDKQGPDKRMVLIKEKRKNARPLITKLVYLESTEEILYLMVDNEVIIDN